MKRTRGFEISDILSFFADAKKKEAQWTHDYHLRDVLLHRYEGHRLLLQCVVANPKGEGRLFLPPPTIGVPTGRETVFFGKSSITLCGGRHNARSESLMRK
ncbi:hypothetical protein ABB02_00296 [Clostridiaceae bacterium JG1575]|nr:hypothetical protein ABB02_00296 [Clostridiaceae bacterium JG1575]